MEHSGEPIRIPTSGGQLGHKKVPPLYVLTSSPNHSSSDATPTSSRPVEYQFPISVGYHRQVSPRVQNLQDQIIQQNHFYRQRSSLSSTNRHAVLPAIGANLTPDNVMGGQTVPTPGMLREQTYITQPTQPSPVVATQYSQKSHLHAPGSNKFGNKMNIVFQPPNSASHRSQHHYELSSKPVVPSIQQQPGVSYTDQGHSSSCNCCGRNIAVIQSHHQYHQEYTQQQQRLHYAHHHHEHSQSDNHQNYLPEHHHSQNEYQEPHNNVPSQQQLPLLQVTGDDQSYVHRWLINPSHPYMVTTSTEPSSQEQSQQPSLPSQLTTPTQSHQQQSHQKLVAEQNKIENTTSITVVLPHQQDSARAAKRHRSKDIPIRYLEPPTHQVVNRSGKLLTPEDALKRTLKGKKIPPLTKRNSLRSIFSDASSNLEKIAEELDEEMKLPVGEPVETSDITFSFDNVDESLTETKVAIPTYPPTTARSFNHSSQSKTNFALLCRLMIDVGNAALVAVFNQIYSPISLAEHLSKPQLQKAIRRLKVQGLITDAQYETLYPKRSTQTVSSENFGPLLLITLLRTICHLSPPYPNGWYDLPLPNDKGLSADLARITWYRKHLSSLDVLKDEEFSHLWHQLTEVFTRLAEEQCSTLIKKIQREIQNFETQEYYIQALYFSQEKFVTTKTDNELKPPQKHKAPVSRRSTVMSLNVVSPLPMHTDAKTKPLSARENLPPSRIPRRTSITESVINWQSSKDSGMSQEDRNTLLMSYKSIIETVRAEECVDHMTNVRVFSREDRSNVMACRTSKEKIKTFLEILPSRSSQAYTEFYKSIESRYPQLAQKLKKVSKTVTQHEMLKALDLRVYLRDLFKKYYKKQYGKITPYFWDESITTDIKSHYTQLDVTDLKGRRYPIERLFCDLTKPTRVLLEGQAGSGKSTYCLKQIHDWTRGDNLQKFDFLIYLDANSINESLEDSIYNQFQLGSGELNLSQQDVMSVLVASQNKLLFILDNYNSYSPSSEIQTLLKETFFEDSSVLITCQPMHVPHLLPHCDKRLINLGLDLTHQDEFIRKYVLETRDKAENYSGLISSTLHYMGKDYEYLMKSPTGLSLLCLLCQHEINLEKASTFSLLYKSCFELYPFLYSLKNGLVYSEEQPSGEILQGLESLRCLAFDTVMVNPSKVFPLQLVKNYDVADVAFTMGVLKKVCAGEETMVCFKRQSLQEFLAAWRLSQMHKDEFRHYSEKLISDPRLHQTCVYFVGCKRYDYDVDSNILLQDFFTLMASQAVSKAGMARDTPTSLELYQLALECVSETENRKDSLTIIGSCLPPAIEVSAHHSISSCAIRGLTRILSSGFSKVKHLHVELNSMTYYNMDTYVQLASSIKFSTTVTHLTISYTSTDLLTYFLSQVLKDYTGQISTLKFESKVSATEKLSASTYTDLKASISALNGISSFHLSGCRHSLVLKNIIRNLPRTLKKLVLESCLIDSIAALDLTSHLDSTTTLRTLSLYKSELVDGASCMNLFKGMRINRSLQELILTQTNLNTQYLKVLCEALKFNRHLKTLDMTDLELSTQSCVSIAGLITVNQCLTHLILTVKLASQEGFKIINEASRNGLSIIEM